MENPANRAPALDVETPDPQHEPHQRAQWILFLAGTTLAALCIDFGAFHRLHNSDSIVPVMMSLYRWTPFYWEQDRFGMLVPFLAIPFKGPLANLLVQSAINAFCSLAAFFLSARYVIPKAWLFTGAVSASLFLLFNNVDARFLYLGLSQPYGVGMCLGFAGLLLLENPKLARPLRIAFGFACLLAASWVDAAVIFVLLPVTLLRWYFDRGGFRKNEPRESQDQKRSLDRAIAVATTLVILSFVASYAYSGIVSRSAPNGDWPYAPVQPWKLPIVWLQFGKAVWIDYLSQPWGISVAVVLVLGAIVRLIQRGRNEETNPSAAILIASALVSFLLMGSLAHIQDTEFDSRFALPSMVLLEIGAVAWALLPLNALMKRSGRRALTAASMILFLLAPIYLYGRPSLARVRADLDETLGQYTPDVVQSGATHFIGDYWNVWPATFHANLKLYESGSDRKVWGVTDRSTPTEIYWSKIPPEKTRYAAVIGDPGVAYVVNLYSFPPLTTVETFKDIVILAPTPNSAPPR